MGGSGGPIPTHLTYKCLNPGKLFLTLSLNVYFKLLLTDVQMDKRHGNSKKQTGMKICMKAQETDVLYISSRFHARCTPLTPAELPQHYLVFHQPSTLARILMEKETLGKLNHAPMAKFI